MSRLPSYRQELIDAIRVWLPAAFFARWKLRRGLTWTPQRLVWTAFLVVWGADQTLGERFHTSVEVLRSLFPHWRLGHTYTGWNDALAAWTPHLAPALARRFRQHMQDRAGRHWRREGWCAFAVDGSRFECPRTAANEARLGCAGKKRTAPQLFLTTLWHMGLGLPWDFRVGPGTASERRHLEDMLADLPPQALLVADAGFPGFDLCARIMQARHAFLLRVGSNLRLLQRLGWVKREGADTVYLWPDKQQGQPPLVLRLIQRGRGKQRLYLLTNVRERADLSQQSAERLYEMRWGVEVFYRSCKQTLQKRKLLSRSPESAEVELRWAVLGIWLLGLLSVKAVLDRGGDPLGVSVARVRQVLRQALRGALGQRRGKQRLQEALAEAVQDNYQRQGSKKARAWPHKKREKPPGAPKIKEATPQQRRKAQRLQKKLMAA
jgi:hypothetical protein